MNNPDPIIRDLEIMSGALNYNHWIFSRFSPYLGSRVMEVGAGIGNFTARMLDREIVIAADIYGPCVEYLKERFAGRSNIIPMAVDISSQEIMRLKAYRIDTVMCFNVLEHVRDDSAALANMFDIMQDGGKLLLLVPAFKPLFGTIDRLVGHYRRYDKSELQKKLAEAGFFVRDIYFMNSVAFFGWFLNNRILKKREESPAQVKFYDTLFVPWLRRLESMVRPPFGLSVVAIAEKK